VRISSPMTSLVSATTQAVQSSHSGVLFLAALASASEGKNAVNIPVGRTAVDSKTTSSGAAIDTKATADQEAQSTLPKDDISSHRTAGASQGEEQKVSPSNMPGGAETGRSSSETRSGSSTVTKEKYGRAAANETPEHLSSPPKIANSVPEISAQTSQPYSTHSAALANVLDNTIAPGSSASFGTKILVSAPTENGTTNKPDEKQSVPVLSDYNGPKEDISSSTLPTSAKSAPENLIPASSAINGGAAASRRVSESNQVASVKQVAQPSLERGSAVAETTAFIGQQYALTNIASNENRNGLQLTHGSDGLVPPNASSESSKPFAQSGDLQASNVAHVLLQQLTPPQLAPDAAASLHSAVQPGQSDLAASHAGAADADNAVPLMQAGASSVEQAIVTSPIGDSFPLPRNLTTVAAVSNNAIGAADASQPTTKAAQKDASTTASVKNQDPADVISVGATKTTATAAGTHDPSSHPAQSSSSQSSHDSAMDASQGPSATPKIMDSGAPQSTAAVMHAASPDNTTPHRVADIPADTTRPSHDREVQASIHADANETVAPSSINTARLIQSMSETEMRVGMHSSEFGEISIRTTVSQQQMLTQISLDHNELSQAISAHVSGAQAKLGDEHGLHALIEINNQGASFASNSGQSSPREQRTTSNSVRSQGFTASFEVDKAVSVGALASAGSGHTLDIRA
jgi:hypothetical protein